MDEPRRRVVIACIVGGAFTLAGIADLVVSGKRQHRGVRLAAQVPPGSNSSPSAGPSTTPPTSTAAGPTTAANGRVIASVAALQNQGAIAFDAQGTPSVLLATANGGAVAYSRVCTHAGCLVQYDPQARVLVCPCHGAEYDPAHGAAVIAGPAPSPLSPVAVRVADGSVFLVG